MANGNGWRQVQWTVVAAVIIAAIGAAAAGWREFGDLRQSHEFLRQSNDQQTMLLQTLKDAIHALHEQNSRQGDADVAIRDRLKEHEDYLRHILERLRALEKAPPAHQP